MQPRTAPVPWLGDWRTALALCLVLSSGLSCRRAAEPANYTPEDLWAAAKQGEVEQVRAILAAGVNVDDPTPYGATALAFAAERGHLQVVKALVDAGADVNHADDFYHVTPLGWATSSDHSEVVTLLQERGAKTDAVQAESPSQDTTVATTDTPWDYPAISPEKIASDDRAASATQWPQFRGFSGRGIADGQHPPIAWDMAQPANLVWKTAIAGLGHSCPVIWDDRMYVTSAVSSADNHSLTIGYYGNVDSVEDLSKHRYEVHCLNADTGAILWSRTAIETVPHVKRHLKSTHANPTIATDGTFVLAFFGSEGLYCYDRDGKRIWSKNLGDLDSGWFYDSEYQWGFGSSPILHDGNVIVQCDVQKDSFVTALRLSDGETVWRTSRDEIPSWSTPCVHTTPAGPLLITNATRAIRGYDASTGVELWSLVGSSEIVVPTPIVAYDTMVISSGYSPIQPIYAVTLNAHGNVSLAVGEQQNQFIRWSDAKAGPYMPSPLAYRGRLYVCKNNGAVSCFDLASGKRYYTKRLKSEGTLSFVASPVAADGHIYFPAEDGHVLVLRDGEKFQQVADNTVGENVLATPAICRGKLYIRGQQHIFALTAADDDTTRESE